MAKKPKIVLSDRDETIRTLWAGLGPRSPSGNVEWSLREIGTHLTMPKTTVADVCKRHGWIRQEATVRALNKKGQSKLANRVITNVLGEASTRDLAKANLIELSAMLKAASDFERKTEEAIFNTSVDTHRILDEIDAENIIEASFEEINNDNRQEPESDPSRIIEGSSS